MLPPCGYVIAGSRNFAGCGPSAYFIRLPSVVAISLLEVEIILIFNARRRIYMIDSYYKVRQLLQSVTDFIIKCVGYYEV